MSDEAKKPTKKERHEVKLRIAAALEKLAAAVEQLANQPMFCDGCAKGKKL